MKDHDLACLLIKRFFSGPLKTKSALQIRGIYNGIKYPLEKMWTDESLNKLFNSDNDAMIIWLYTYCRDNQDKFDAKTT